MICKIVFKSSSYVFTQKPHVCIFNNQSFIYNLKYTKIHTFLTLEPLHIDYVYIYLSSYLKLRLFGNLVHLVVEE